MLQKYDRGASKHVYDIVTGDESWIYAYEPESKQQSTVWVFQDEPNPTKVARARPGFMPQVRHQNENLKKYFLGDFHSADFSQKFWE